MSYFDTTPHGWRLSTMKTGTLPSFTGTGFISTSAVFDGTHLYVTYRDVTDTGIGGTFVRETYKYSFNSTTMALTYITKVANGANCLVDDGADMWGVNHQNFMRITKAGPWVNEYTGKPSDGIKQSLQRFVHVTPSYVWAIEWYGSSTTNQKLYRLDKASGVTTAFSPTWGLAWYRLLCGVGTNLYSNPISGSNNSVLIPMVNQVTGVYSTQYVTCSSTDAAIIGVAGQPLNDNITSRVISMTPCVDGSGFHMVLGTSFVITAGANYLPIQAKAFAICVVNTTSNTLTVTAHYTNAGLSVDAASDYICLASFKGTASSSVPDADQYLRQISQVAHNPTTGTLFATNVSSDWCGVNHFYYGAGEDYCVVDSQNYRTPTYYTSGRQQLQNTVPLGGATYTEWQKAPAQAVALNTRVGGVGTDETAYTFTQSSDQCIATNWDYLFTVGGSQYTITRLGTRARDSVIRPHMLTVGCNVGIS